MFGKIQLTLTDAEAFNMDYQPEKPKAIVDNLMPKNMMDKKYKRSRYKDRSNKWIEEEDFISNLIAKHKKELEELTRKYEKKIAYL